MSGYIRPATEADIYDIESRLRPADALELRALTGFPPLVTLLEGFRISDRSWAVCTAEGQVAALIGTQPVFGDEGAGWVWMVATDLVSKHRIEFLRRCHAALPEIFGNYELLMNHVDARNDLHIRWLRWLGFTFFRTVEKHGAEGLPFIEFAKIRPTN